MPPKGVQPVSVRRGDEWLLEATSHPRGPAVGIKRALVKMTKLDRVKTILFREQARADRAAEHIKWMRRDGEEGLAAPGTKGTHVLKGL